MSDPYRTEDPVAKLQAENEKLRQENDRLMWRFSALRKWPAYLFFGLMVAMVSFGSFYAGTSVSSENSERVTVGPYYRIDSQEHRLIAAEVTKRLMPALASHAHGTASSRACPAPPVCANGTDERVLGMNKVVSGTIGGPETGPLNEEWKFSVRAGETVVFRMKKKSGDLNPFLVIEGPEGNLLEFNDNSGGYPNATLYHHFTSSGIYILRCMDGELGEGSYTLSATRVRTR